MFTTSFICLFPLSVWICFYFDDVCNDAMVTVIKRQTFLFRFVSFSIFPMSFNHINRNFTFKIVIFNSKNENKKTLEKQNLAHR